MDREEARKFVASRSWYQTIDFEPGLRSIGCKWCGDPAWSNIVKFLPESLEGKSLLDVGCNAGLFCVRAALMGAESAIGIDWAGWRPKWDFVEQQVFVKKYFEEKAGRELPVAYIQGKMEEVISTFTHKFDYVLGIASLYYSENPDKLVREISRITDTAIVRLRDESKITLFTSLFKEYGFKEEEVLREKWWEKLDCQTDDFYLYLFTK